MLKAYRPYESFGMIDSEQTFNSLKEFLACYKEWASEDTGEWECIELSDGELLLHATDMGAVDYIRQSYIDDGLSFEEADEKAWGRGFEIDKTIHVYGDEKILSEIEGHFKCSGGYW